MFTRLILVLFGSVLFAVGAAGCGDASTTPATVPTTAPACTMETDAVVTGETAPIPVGVIFSTPVTLPDDGGSITYTVKDAQPGVVITIQMVSDADRLRLVNGDAVEVFSEADSVQSATGTTPALAAGAYDLLVTCVYAESSCSPVISISVNLCEM
jgi:hypothetical protein